MDSSVAIQSDIDHLKLNYGGGNHYLQVLLLFFLSLSLVHSLSFRSINVHIESKVLLPRQLSLDDSSHYTSNYIIGTYIFLYV
jgi:hypothetical protein